jgi:hypothetical protein
MMALVAQHAKRMRRIMSSVAYPALPHFSYYLARHDFQGVGKAQNIKRVFDLLYKFCPKHFSF